MMMNNTPDMFKALKIAALARYSKTKTEISDSQGHSGLPTEDHWHTTVFVQTGIVIQHLTFKKPERALVAVSYFLFFEMPLFFKQLLIVVGFITSASGPRELHGACKLDHVAGHRNQVYHDCYKCGNGHAVCYSSSHKLTATILTAQRSFNRSTVSIVFVLQVDELLYSGTCPTQVLQLQSSGKVPIQQSTNS